MSPGTVSEIVVEQEGTPLVDRVINDLIQTRVGAPLQMAEVRETITHLMSLGRYEDVQVMEESGPAGVRIRYVLVPLHPIDKVEYRGTLAVRESDLRRVIADRFATAVAEGRITDLQQQLEAYYRDRGYVSARITPRVESTHNPDRATLVFDIAAGPQATIVALDVDDVEQAERAALTAELRLATGQPYDADLIQTRLDRYQGTLRSRGYYEARARHFATFDAAGGARVTVTLERGPHVSVAFAGDSIPEAERAKLVPIQSEGSADEDLLEDSSRAIEDYFKTRGYREAVASYERSEAVGELTITFTVSRGPRYVTDTLKVAGNTAVPTPVAIQSIGLKSGAPFVQASLDGGLQAIRNAYRSQGFTKADVRGTAAILPGEGSGPGDDRHLDVQVTINEGPRTRIGAVTIEGEQVLTDQQLRALMTATPGRPFSETEVATDRDRIDLEYRNRGYDSVVVDPRVTLADGDTRADIRLTISEGPQVFVDHVIILGNSRTSVDTIARELTLKSGSPLAYSALLESQQRLGALGLFRRIQISQVPHPGEPRSDLIVRVEEAPPTTFSYGGGIEGGTRLRATGENGQAEERFEFAPRGFVEIGRRNLWGKNRAVTLFSRASLRSRDILFAQNGVQLVDNAASNYGVNEYRVFGTYREPRIFGSKADVLITGILEQAIRSSFNYITREVRAEAGMRLTNHYSVAGRYSFEHTRLFDERFTDAEKPLIDRLFPQVRLSKFAGSFIRDSRDDVVYPTKGTFSLIDGELAMQAIGSEVGFAKTFVQSFAYVPLKTKRKTIVALGARVGLAHGFTLGALDSGGSGEVLLPASERFFAGGDTTVRGFALDRLGDKRTISASGFPTGGNGEVVLNAELRVSVFGTKAEAVGFVDAGNVYPKASDFNLFEVRPTVGFGARYRSPVGPIRVDLGFNVDRREVVPGTLERPYVLHISLGQAF